MKRWGLYFSIVVLLLFALAIGGLNLLYRLRVKPALTAQLAVQSKYKKAYESDIVFLNAAASRLGYNMVLKASDAGEFLNSRVYWSPRPVGSKIGLSKSLVLEETKIEIARLRHEWILLVGKGRSPRTDLTLFENIGQYDHWDLERGSPIGELMASGKFVPPTRLPIPEVSDLMTIAKLRLVDGGLRKDYLPALRDVRSLAQLMMTTENLQLVLAGIAMLDVERTAYDYFVKESGLNSNLWAPVEKTVTRRAHRAVLATRGFLRLWTRAEDIQKFFLGETSPPGFCAAVNEALPFDYSLRRVLEPHLPFEMETSSEYARLDRVLLKARTKCRLRYLSKLANEHRFYVPVPGPWPLTSLPYSRKLFGLRLSFADLGGFTGYGRNLASDGDWN